MLVLVQTRKEFLCVDPFILFNNCTSRSHSEFNLAQIKEELYSFYSSKIIFKYL